MDSETISVAADIATIVGVTVEVLALSVKFFRWGNTQRMARREKRNNAPENR